MEILSVHPGVPYRLDGLGLGVLRTAAFFVAFWEARFRETLSAATAGTGAGGAAGGAALGAAGGARIGSAAFGILDSPGRCKYAEYRCWSRVR